MWSGYSKGNGKGELNVRSGEGQTDKDGEVGYRIISDPKLPGAYKILSQAFIGMRRQQV